jgi:hypothetical protein
MVSRVTEIGFQYGVAALSKKRAELDGEIASLKLQLRDRRRELSKIDDALLILAPGKDPAAIPPKRPLKYRNLFRSGELGRIILGVLRSEQRPLTNIEVGRIVFQRGGFSRRLWEPILRRTRANLAYLEAQGRACRSGRGRQASWHLPLE